MYLNYIYIIIILLVSLSCSDQKGWGNEGVGDTFSIKRQKSYNYSEMLSGDLDSTNKMKFDNQLTYGISCLSAQVISHFKKRAGDFYLHTADTRDYGEEFVYIIYSKDNELKVKVEDVYGDKVIFNGNTKEMDKWIGYDDRPEFDITEAALTRKMPNSLIRQKEDGFTD